MAVRNRYSLRCGLRTPTEKRNSHRRRVSDRARDAERRPGAALAGWVLLGESTVRVAKWPPCWPFAIADLRGLSAETARIIAITSVSQRQ